MDQLILKASSCQKPLDMQQVVLWIRWISTEYIHIKLRYFDICYSELNGEKGRAWIFSPLCLAYVSVCLLSMQVLWKKRWSRQNALARVRTAGIKMMLQHCQTISQQTKHIVINCTCLTHQPEWSHSNQGTIPFSHKLQGLVHRMVVGWPVYPSKSILSVVNKSLLTVDSFVQCLWQHSHLSGSLWPSVWTTKLLWRHTAMWPLVPGHDATCWLCWPKSRNEGLKLCFGYIKVQNDPPFNVPLNFDVYRLDRVSTL